MSRTETLPPLAECQERHATACDLKQAVDRSRAGACLLTFAERVIKRPVDIRFIATSAEMIKYGKAARDAWAARAARAAWDARAAWAARAARDARAAWDAWDARDAWDTWDARDARDARAAWAAWDASWDLSWFSITAVGALARADRETYLKWEPLLGAFEAGAWAIWFLKEEIVVADIPARPHLDDRRRLHRTDGAAFEWLDIRDHYWHGVYVPEHVVCRPASITIAEIEAEKNTEVRRVMVERFGQDRFLVESGAREFARDDYGVLYRKEMPGDEPLVMVRVVNSTAEPDGTFKDYYLRVPPQMKTAREAVAWTFGMSADEYAPLIQT